MKGGVFSERITMEIFSGEKDAQLLKKLIDMAAGKRSKFNIFTSVSRGEECALKVWCGWEDMPFVTSIINEFKKIRRVYSRWNILGLQMAWKSEGILRNIPY